MCISPRTIARVEQAINFSHEAEKKLSSIEKTLHQTHQNIESAAQLTTAVIVKLLEISCLSAISSDESGTRRSNENPKDSETRPSNGNRSDAKEETPSGNPPHSTAQPSATNPLNPAANVNLDDSEPDKESGSEKKYDCQKPDCEPVTTERAAKHNVESVLVSGAAVAATSYYMPSKMAAAITAGTDEVCRVTNGERLTTKVARQVFGDWEVKNTHQDGSKTEILMQMGGIMRVSKRDPQGKVLSEKVVDLQEGGTVLYETDYQDGKKK